MSKEYAVYPFLAMRITQRHDEGNHLAHWNPLIDWADKPWDEACEDGNRSYFVPQNDYVVVEKSGNQNGGYNVRLKSKNKLTIPYQEDSVYLEITLTHLNYDDYSKLSVNQVLTKGTKILREGTSGQASGNHLHMTANIGKYYGFLKNANGKYCFTYEKSLLPNEAFYIDKKITKVYSAKNYVFTDVPKEEFLPARGYITKGDINENVRKVNEFLSTLVKGNLFGDYSVAIVKEFQKQNKLETDGNIGPLTLAKLKEKGFKE